MDLAQWPQEIVVKPMEEIVPPITTTTTASGASNTTKPVSSSNCVERKIRPDQAVNCPRCNSTNTKFCYYNNYSLSQPRYFCKTCRRYWTEGGSLRNIPVGGGSRKNRRSSSSSSSCSSSSSTTVAAASNGLAVKKLLPADLLVPPVPIPLHHHHLQNPNKIQQDLNLGFSHHHSHQDFKTIAELIQVPNYESNTKESNNNSSNHPHHPSSSPASASQLSALELLTGMTSSSTRGLISSFIPMPIPDPNNNSVYSSFSLPEFKPSLNFSLDGIGNGGGGYFGNHHHHNHHHHLQGMQETTTSGGAVDGSGGRLFFPFEDLKSGSAPDNGAAEQDRDSQAGHGYWNGVLGAGGGSW